MEHKVDEEQKEAAYALQKVDDDEAEAAAEAVWSSYVWMRARIRRRALRMTKAQATGDPGQP